VKRPSFLNQPAFRYAMAGLLTALVAFSAWKVGVPVFHEFLDSFAMKEFKEKGVYGTYKHHFFRFTDQLEDLARMDRENDELQQKVADLEKRSTLLETKQVEREIAAVNEHVEDTLRDQAGSELATAKTTLKFEIPRNLSYAQLYALGLGYFKSGDYEKSAVLMDHLLNLKDEPKYRVPENFLISGISWFKLKNYHLSMRDVTEAKNASHPADPTYQSALLWESMIQKNLGRAATSQETLLKYVELYPHSEESQFVNEGRKPASLEPKAEEEDEEETDE